MQQPAILAKTGLVFKIVPLALLLCGSVVSAQPAGSPPPVPVTVAEVRVETFADRIEALGTLSANESVNLTTTVMESVESLHFEDGQRVKRGDLLARLSATEEEALLVEARATVNEAEKQYERAKQLAVGGATAAAQLDETRRNYETARARVAAIESRIAELSITAPFDGITGLRNISVGALIRPGDLITTLDDDSVMKLDFTIPAVFLSALEPGMLIEAKSRAYGAQVFQGSIRSVSSRVDPVTRSVTVRAEIPNPGRLLKPGLLMTVELLSNKREALLIPEAALLQSGQKVFVMALDETDGKPVARQRPVGTGGRRAGYVEVVSGLSAGERIIVDGAFKTTDGGAVRLMESRPGGKTGTR